MLTISYSEKPFEGAHRGLEAMSIKSFSKAQAEAQYGAELNAYQAEIGKISADYQWIQGQLAYLKNHYNELFGMVSRGQ